MEADFTGDGAILFEVGIAIAAGVHRTEQIAAVVERPLHEDPPAATHWTLRSMANGSRRGPPTPSSGGTRSSSGVSGRRPCCPRPRPRRCCSRRCSPPARSRCARSMAGRSSDSRWPTACLTAPLEPMPPLRRRHRQPIPATFATTPNHASRRAGIRKAGTFRKPSTRRGFTTGQGWRRVASATPSPAFRRIGAESCKPATSEERP